MIISDRDSPEAIQARAELLLRNMEDESQEQADPADPLSLHDFVRGGWHVNEPTTPFIDGWHIGAICEHLTAVSDGEIRKLIINVPPGSTKSFLTCVYWPAWMWGERSAGLKYLFSAYAHDLALRDSTRMRQLIRSNWYQMRYGSHLQIQRGQDTKGRYDTTMGGYRIATSVAGVGTGERADIVVVDDPHKKMEVRSPPKREGVNEWWRTEMRTRGTKASSVRFVIIMQRLHEHDLTGFALSEMSGYEHLFIPFRYEEKWNCSTKIGWSDPRKEEGDLYWHKMYNEEEAQELEQDLSTDAPGQLQQRPYNATGEIFKESWFRFWQPPDMNLGPVMIYGEDDDGNPVVYEIDPVTLDTNTMSEYHQSWDMAFKDTKMSAYVCGQQFGVLADKPANKYLLDLQRAKMDLPKSIAGVRRMTKLWPKTMQIIIEDKANGPAVMQSLRDEIEGIIAFDPGKYGNKESRANAVAPMIKAGNLVVPHPALYPWVRPYIAEMVGFPFGAYNDQVDTTTQALIKLRRSGDFGGIGGSHVGGMRKSSFYGIHK